MAKTFKEVDVAEAKGINFNRLQRADFDGDGTLDRVICKRDQVEVVAGDGSGNKIYSWSGPSTKAGYTRAVARCEVIELAKGRPSIFIAWFWMKESTKVREASEQFLIHNRGSQSYTATTLKLADGSTYKAVARSVKCAPYPAALEKQGFAPGVLCFYAAYQTPGDTTHTALFKIEEKQGKLVAKDITASSGLPWNGAKGTFKLGIPLVMYCDGKFRFDGLHMMDSALIDVNSDGLPDLVTVGQHASMRASIMAFDKARPEGVAFATTKITQAKVGTMTEFLTVRSFNALEPHLGSSCVYVSGEHWEGCPVFEDHLRCYENGGWSKVKLPLVFSSEYSAGTVRANGDGQVLIKTLARKRVDGKIVKDRDLVFAAPYRGELIGSADGDVGAAELTLRGFACEVNSKRPVEILALSAAEGSPSVVTLGKGATGLESSLQRSQRCLQPSPGSFNFSFALPLQQVLAQSRMVSVYARVQGTKKTTLLGKVDLTGAAPPDAGAPDAGGSGTDAGLADQASALDLTGSPDDGAGVEPGPAPSSTSGGGCAVAPVPRLPSVLGLLLLAVVLRRVVARAR